MNKKTIYFIWIGGIWISALARYYLQTGYTVYGTDMVESLLIWKLRSEGIHITIWQTLTEEFSLFDKVIYTEAVPIDHPDLLKAQSRNIPCLSYPKWLAEIVNMHKLIAIAWTHWKSTTTSLTSLVFKNSKEDFSALVGSVLKEFSGKNFFSNSLASETNPEDSYFIIEACEYKRSFLQYTPHVWVIINIEIDHLDYYKDLDDYLSAYKDFISNIHAGGFAILNWEDSNCKKLLWLRDDIHYIEVYKDRYAIYATEEEYFYNNFDLQVPGSHILFDANIAYTVWLMAWISEELILDALESYTGIWRRMEHIWMTKSGNILMSDYGHHPTEISLTLEALKQKYPDKTLYSVFQPHQYNRTIELLDWFKECFSQTDFLVIPNIYESRDSQEDKNDMSPEKLVSQINHPHVTHGNSLVNTLSLIKDFDKDNTEAIILLLWAWDVDNLREGITTK